MYIIDISEDILKGKFIVFPRLSPLPFLNDHRAASPCESVSLMHPQPAQAPEPAASIFFGHLLSWF